MRHRGLYIASTVCIVSFLAILVALSPRSAEAERAGNDSAPLVEPEQAPPDDHWVIYVVYTDPANVPITDLAGTALGEGVHLGQARCNRDNCNQKTTLQFTIPVTDYTYEYKFAARQAFDPIQKRVVVAGSGRILGDGQNDKFLFTATFQDNWDGTVRARYEASRPDASFIVPRSRGNIVFRRLK